MKTAQQWFDEYGVSHKNPTNKLIHWICVPSIFFSIVGMLAAIPHDSIDGLFPAAWAPFVHWGTLLILFGSIFYLLISFSIFLGMLLVSGLVLWGVYTLSLLDAPLWFVNLIIFVVAWVGQFIGHHIEGAKPSFFKDLQFLLVGPAWLLHFIYKKTGIPY